MQWLEFLWKQRNGCLSYQVLQEYYVTVTQKLTPGLPKQAAQDDVRALIAWKPLSVDHTLIEIAWTVQTRFKFSWWDSLIIAAAQQLESRYLLTEDLQEDQDINGVKIINPFVNSPEQIYA